ncbi:MAG: hypothetical protein ACRCVG_00195 [Methanobacteriaceae archaeon]
MKKSQEILESRSNEGQFSISNEYKNEYKKRHYNAVEELNFSKTASILSSNIRTKILISLYYSSKTLAELRESINKQSSSIIHGINILKSEEMIIKNKQYALTSKGYLIASNLVKLVENWYSINFEIEFWLDHDISDIPLNFLRNRYILEFSEDIDLSIENYTTSSYKYSKKIASSKNLKILIPFFGEEYLNFLINNIPYNCNLELITTPEIFFKMDKEKYYKKLKEKTRANIYIWTMTKIPNVYLTCSEQFFSLGLFLKKEIVSSDIRKNKRNDRNKVRKKSSRTLSDLYGLSRIMISKQSNSIKWGENLFEEYKNNAILTYK